MELTLGNSGPLFFVVPFNTHALDAVF